MSSPFTGDDWPATIGNEFILSEGCNQMVRRNVHKKTTGGCLCAKVQFEIQGKIMDIVN